VLNLRSLQPNPIYETRTKHPSLRHGNELVFDGAAPGVDNEDVHSSEKYILF
jgi:hypothetical protein